MRIRIHCIQFAWQNWTCLLSMRPDQFRQWRCHLVHIGHNLQNYDSLEGSLVITRADDIQFDDCRRSLHIRVFYICAKSKHRIVNNNINSLCVWEHLLNSIQWMSAVRTLLWIWSYFIFNGKLPIRKLIILILACVAFNLVDILTWYEWFTGWECCAQQK